MAGVVTTGWRSACAGAFALLGSLFSSGCASIGAAAAEGVAEGLSASILDADDPALVREALPAYLLLMDALVRNAPDDSRTLAAAAQLYAVYGAAFVAEPERASALTTRARDYGIRALCSVDESACGINDREYGEFAAVVDQLKADADQALFSYCVASLAWTRANSDDWTAIAGLPKIEHALLSLLQRSQSVNAGNINTYLGILNTLRPESLGGQPESGRAYFERAIELSAGRDLAAKMELARSYARLVYDRELHDRLLNEVLAAPVRAEGLTLFNVLAQQEARTLLDSADDYF
jgi:TRAP transporter T-component